MAKKKKKQSQQDPLIISGIVLTVIVIVTNLYLRWNTSNPLNTLSSTATSITWSLWFPTIFMIGTIFWLLMLIDSWRKNKLVWFIFILFGAGLIGLLYFLIEKPKIIQENSRKLVWLAIILFFLSWAVWALPELKNRINPPPDTAPLVSIQGKLISKDVPNGPGIYKVREQGSNQTLEVDVGTDDGPCDIRSVNIPDLKIGDSVLVYAKQYDALGRYVSACAAGTYINKN